MSIMAQWPRWAAWRASWNRCGIDYRTGKARRRPRGRCPLAHEGLDHRCLRGRVLRRDIVPRRHVAPAGGSHSVMGALSGGALRVGPCGSSHDVVPRWATRRAIERGNGHRVLRREPVRYLRTPGVHRRYLRIRSAWHHHRVHACRDIALDRTEGCRGTGVVGTGVLLCCDSCAHRPLLFLGWGVHETVTSSGVVVTGASTADVIASSAIALAFSFVVIVFALHGLSGASAIGWTSAWSSDGWANRPTSTRWSVMRRRG